VIDITHGIPPQQVLHGALTLADTLPYMPVGVHVAVVDPGVGSERRALALRGGDGRLYVGPDNGLLLLAADRLGGVTEAVEIANRAFMLEPISHTFHGRDVFAPAAAHLALGVPLGELGPALETASLVRLEVPASQVGPGGIATIVLAVDRFGNVQLNLRRDELERAGVAVGAGVEIFGPFERLLAVVAHTFADVRPGDLVVYENAYGYVTLAINGGRASEMLSVQPGEGVRLALVRVPSRE
jgi:S-adenosylmethionine hydrolase